MQVRGASAVAIVGALSIASDLNNANSVLNSKDEIVKFVCESLEYLLTARPTAVNLMNARMELEVFLRKLLDDPEETTDSMKLKCGLFFRQHCTWLL